jgi:hypothetical protein
VVELNTHPHDHQPTTPQKREREILCAG